MKYSSTAPAATPYNTSYQRDDIAKTHGEIGEDVRVFTGILTIHEHGFYHNVRLQIESRRRALDISHDDAEKILGRVDLCFGLKRV